MTAGASQPRALSAEGAALIEAGYALEAVDVLRQASHR